VNEVTRSRISRPCGASASDPPLSPWYEWYLSDQESITHQVDAVHDPEPAPYKFRLMADQSCRDGDLDAARRDIAAAIDGYRTVADEWGLADALAVKASIARAAGEIDAAAENYRESLSIFNILGDLPSTIRLYRALGEARFAAGDYAAVIALYLEALSLVPGDPVLLTGLGYASWYEGRPGDALTYLTQALHVEGDNQPALSALGQLEADTGHPKEALADLDRALALNAPGTAEDEEADLRSARALALAQLGEHAAAEAELSAAFGLRPRRARTFLRAARIRLQSGDRTTARSLLGKALAATPPLPPGHAAKARALLAPSG
jgi:tetratricopeptide (TPR) repeat protein